MILMHDTVEPLSPKQYAVLALIHIPNTRFNTMKLGINVIS